MALTSEQFVRQVRLANKYTHSGAFRILDDAAVYRLGKIQFPEIEVAPYKPQEPNISQLETVDTSPEKLNGMMKWFDDAIDYGVDENSSMMMKMSFNNSMTGLAYKILTGKDKYPEVARAIASGEYDPGILEEIGAGLMGFLYPLDALTMFYGAPLYAKGGVKLGQMVGVKALGSKGITSGIVSSALGLGFFMGGANTLAEMADQRVKIDKREMDGYDTYKLLNAAVEGHLEGSVLGASIGGITGVFGKANKAIQNSINKTKGGATIPQKIGKLVTSKPSAFASEVGAFTTVPYAWHGAPRKEDGSLDTDMVFRDLAINTGILGGLKLGFGVFHKDLWEDINKEHRGALKDKVKKLENDAKLADKTIPDSNPNKAEIIGDIIREREGILEELDLYDSKIYNKIAKSIKIFDEAGELDTKEQREAFIEKHGEQSIIDAITGLRELSPVLELLKEKVPKEDILAELKKKHGIEDVEGVVETTLFERYDKLLELNESNRIKLFEEHVLGEKKKAETKVEAEAPKISGLTKEQWLKKKLKGETNSIEEIWKTRKMEGSIPKTKQEAVDRLFAEKAEKIAVEKEIVAAGTPESPANLLSRALKELKTKVSDVTKESFFNRKIGGKKKISEYIEEANIGEENKNMAIQGINEFMRNRTNISPADVKRVIDYFKWLDKRGLKVTDASKELTKKYLDSLKLEGVRRKIYNDALARFFGTGKAAAREHITTGFSYKYMDGRSVGEVGEGAPTRTGKKAAPEKVGIVPPKEYGRVKKQKEALIKDGKPLEGVGQKVEPKVFDAITEVLYEFGARGIDALRRLKIENIDWNAGIIKEWSSGKGKKAGAGARTDVPLKEVIPELWDKLVEIKGDRTSGNLFLTTKGKEISGSSINKILEPLTKDLNLTGKKGKTQIQDFRRMITTDAANISKEMLDFVDSYLIKHKQAIAKTYTYQDAAMLWKQFRKERGKLKTKEVKVPVEKKIEPRKRKGERPKEEIEFTTEKERKDFLDWVRKKFKLKDKDLQEVETLGKGTWGQYYDGLIKLARGEWQPIDFFHELTHFHEAVSRKIGDRKMIKMYESLDRLVSGSKTFKDWLARAENKGKDSVEFYTDKIALEMIANEKAKNVGQRFKRWLQNFKSKIMVNIRGGKYASYKDFARVIASEGVGKFEPVRGLDLKGSAAIIGGERSPNKIIRYRGEDRGRSKEELNKVYHGYENELIRKGIYTKEELREMRVNVTGSDNWALGSIDKSSMSKWIDSLHDIVIDIADVSPPSFVSDIKTWRKQFRVYSKNAQKWVTPEVQESILKDLLNVKDGKLSNASVRDLKVLTSMAKSIGEKPKGGENVADIIISAELGKNDTFIKRMKSLGHIFTTPVWYAAKKLGARKISDKLLEHVVTEQLLIGEASKREHDILSKVKMKDLDSFSLMIDKKRYEERLNNGDLTNHEIKLHEKIFDEQGNVRKNKYGEAYKTSKNLIEFFWKKLSIVAKERLNRGEVTRSQYEWFMKEFEKKYVSGYFPRRLTNEYIKHYDPKARHIVKEVDRITKELALVQANELEYSNGITFKNAIKNAENKGNAQLLSEIKDLREKKVSDILSEQESELRAMAVYELEKQFQFNPETVQNRFLKRRKIKLPEFVEVDVGGKDTKKVEVYETRYAETMGNYARIMAKYIATAEQFPEFTAAFRKFGIPSVPSDVLKVRIGNQMHGNWLLKRVLDQVGIQKGEEVMRPIARGLQYAATATSKVALSFYTAGFKNIVVGMPQTIAAFGTFKTLRAIKEVFNLDSRRRLKKVGGEMGMRHFDEVKTLKVFEKLFKFGLMRPTETFNRVVSIFAGRMNLIEALRTIRKGGRNADRLTKHLKDWWHLTDVEVQAFLKYGIDAVSSKNINKIVSSFKNTTIDRALDKVDLWSHINTQGGTATSLVPFWFNKKMAKPFLLFQRMAYAASFNLSQNVIKPMNLIKGRRNILPLIRYLGASTVGGYSLMKLYDWGLGIQPPKSNSSEWEKMATYLWKAEVLGILSETLSPWQSQDQITTSLYPAIWKNVLLLKRGFGSVINDKKFARQAFDDVMKGTISFYNQSSRIINRKNNKYNENFLRLKRLESDFMKEMKIEKPSIDFITERSKFYRDFKDSFNKGSEADAARKYLAAYFAIIDSFMKNNIPEKLAIKEAGKIMKSQVKNLNPIGLSGTKGKRIISLRNNFLMWLSPRFGERGQKGLAEMALKSEAEYNYKWRKVQGEIIKIIKERGLQDFAHYIKHKRNKLAM